jgi:hypothetical protein
VIQPARIAFPFDELRAVLLGDEEGRDESACAGGFTLVT